MYVTYTRIYGWSDYGGESSYQPGYRLENMMWMTLLVYDYIIPGENIQKPCPDDELNLKSISEKLETINLQLAKRSAMRIRIFRWLLIVGCVGIVAGFIFLGTMQSAYLNWDFNNPELAVAGTFLHGVEFLFVRIAPFVFVAFVTGIILTYRKR